ncbi:MAG: HEPN domain-containing protein [Verrucomicrobia bacterium]|nr:HEPN domain-containing protein [Verrucomicrobiota bacterium]
MKQLEQARKFLAKAAEDEALLDAVLDKPEVADSIFGFHAQQAAEKLLKALLSIHAVRFRKTHDLQELVSLLETAGQQLPADLTRVDELTPFGVEWRYDYFAAPAAMDRAEIRALVAKVRAFVEAQINATPP